MANELTYQSVFTGQEMDERFTAVAQLQAALLEVETALSAKYVKPASGIPETDLDSAVQSALAKARSAVQDLSNYYTKTEIDSLLAAVNSQEYVDVATLPTASASTLGKIYLVGPTDNEYDRYYTSYDGSDYSWVAAGSTEINLSNYATKAELNQLDQKVSETEETYSFDFSDTTRNAITNEGEISTSSSYLRSALIEVEKGDVVKFDITLNGNYALIAATSDDANFVVKLQNASTSAQHVEWTSDMDGYIVVSCNKWAQPTTYSIKRIGDIPRALIEANSAILRLDGITEGLGGQISSIEEEIGYYEAENKIGYTEGSLNYVVAYSPFKEIANDGSLIVKLVNSSATGISTAIIRGGSTRYLSMTKVSATEFTIPILADDSIVNIYTAGGGAGDTYEVIYASGMLSDIEENNKSIYRNGIKWMAIGDSLTDPATLEGGNNYVNFVASKLKLLPNNKGLSGTGYWRGHSDGYAFYQRVLNYTDPADIITIFGSLNDLGIEDGVSGGSIIGTYTDNTTDTICGCINKTLDNLETQYPDAIIAVVSPTPWSNSRDNIYPEEYVSKMEQICRYRSIPFLDLFHGSTLRPWDSSFRSDYYKTPDDGAHPNTKGHRRFSGMFSAFIEGLLFP